MKSFLIIFFAVSVVVLGFSAASLRKELISAQENAAFYEKKSGDLQRELMRINRLYVDKVRFLNEIEQSIAELESKVQLETLERYIPKKTWGEIKPIIDKLKAFQETRKK